MCLPIDLRRRDVRIWAEGEVPRCPLSRRYAFLEACSE
jgi:hypothetical protein